MKFEISAGTKKSKHEADTYADAALQRVKKLGAFAKVGHTQKYTVVAEDGSACDVTLKLEWTVQQESEPRRA